MVWGWVHNFPTAKDVFTKPIDYPTVDWDTQIADWYEDIFNAVGAIEDALGYDIRGGYADLNTRLATFASLTIAETEVFNGLSPDPMAWTDLDLSGVVGSNPALVLLKFAPAAGAAPGAVVFRKDGDADEFTGVGCAGGSLPLSVIEEHSVFLVATSLVGVIEWVYTNTAQAVTIDIIAYI